MNRSYWIAPYDKPFDLIAYLVIRVSFPSHHIQYRRYIQYITTGERMTEKTSRTKTIVVQEATWRRLKRMGTMNDTMDSVINRALDCVDRQWRLPED